MAQPTGRPRGRPPGSKNRSTLERERKEKEKMLSESKDEIVNEVVKKVEKMVDSKMDVTTPPKGDKGIVLGGFAGTYQKVAQKGQFSLLKSEQFGDRAYMVLLKGKKVVAKDIATMNDARVVKAIGRAHRRANEADRISKNSPGEMEDKFNEATNLMVDIEDWCEDYGLNVTAKMVRDSVDRFDEAFYKFNEECLEKLDWSQFAKSKKNKAHGKADVGSNRVSKGEVVNDIIMDLSLITEEIDNQISRIKDISGDADIVNVWEMLDSASRLILNACNELEDLGIEKSKKSKVKKDNPEDYLSRDDYARVRSMQDQIEIIEGEVYNKIETIRSMAYTLGDIPGLRNLTNNAYLFKDVDIQSKLESAVTAIRDYGNAIYSVNNPARSAFSDLKKAVNEFVWGQDDGRDWTMDVDVPIEDADYDLSQYEIKSKKGSQSKAPVKDDRGSIGIDIETMIRTRKESKEKPETDLDEPIEAPDEPPVTQGEKPETDPDEPIETPSEPAVSDNGKDDDISSLESSAGPTVIANSNDGPELDIDIDLDDDEDLEKMMARKERMQSQAEPPGRTQPFANNYRTIQMGAGKFNPMDMPKGRNVKP